MPPLPSLMVDSVRCPTNIVIARIWYNFVRACLQLRAFLRSGYEVRSETRNKAMFTRKRGWVVRNRLRETR